MHHSTVLRLRSPSTCPTTTVTVLGPSANWPKLLAHPGHSTVFVSARHIPVSERDVRLYTTTDTLQLVLEAEVRYAVKHEYAQTAIDVIARRTRLSFLNAQAALDALPRVVDLMSNELHWSSARKEVEIAKAVEFLGSMGLQPGAAVPAVQPRGLVERVESAVYSGLGLRGAPLLKTHGGVAHSRSQFESGELDVLRTAFRSRATDDRVAKKDALEVIKGMPGYEAITPRVFDYVLVEAGLDDRSDVSVDEFVEVGFVLLH